MTVWQNGSLDRLEDSSEPVNWDLLYIINYSDVIRLTAFRDRSRGEHAIYCVIDRWSLITYRALVATTPE